MSIFSNLFNQETSLENDLIKPFSKSSRVIDENGEPAIKMHPNMADDYDNEQIKDRILAVAIVNEDLLNDGFEVETFPKNTLANPAIKAVKNGKTIYVAVKSARLPEQTTPLENEEIKKLLSEFPQNLYSAKVELMPIGNDDDTGRPCFFVKYLGLVLVTS